MDNIKEINVGYVQEMFNIAKQYAKSKEEVEAYEKGFSFVNDAIKIQEKIKEEANGKI